MNNKIDWKWLLIIISKQLVKLSIHMVTFLTQTEIFFFFFFFGGTKGLESQNKQTDK